ncbi:MAG: hypothetical protein GF364_20075 [Candidatus Lokiarchaeota archaeon]|nr:hypothetical protein [Candidatus Lokiarchaeota archaeon]
MRDIFIIASYLLLYGEDLKTQVLEQKTMSNSKPKHKQNLKQYKFQIAKPHDLSPRSKSLRDYYFKGLDRKWNNDYMFFTTGTDWDRLWWGGDYYIVPEMYQFIGEADDGVFPSSAKLMGIPIDLPEDFWDKSLPERRMIFFNKMMLNHIPQEIIGNLDLIAGGRFNVQWSKCLTEEEEKELFKQDIKNRKEVYKYHRYGFGNVGATAGHLIPDHKTVLEKGFKFIYNKIKQKYDSLSPSDKTSPKGNELRAMMIGAQIPRRLAAKYREECIALRDNTKDENRRHELDIIIKNLEVVPWNPAQTFWQAIQAIWLTHMLIMAEESYPGPGVSFGRFDQILWPYYKKDVIDEKTISKDFAKDILGCFWFHCNTVYDAQMCLGRNHGITSAYGQLITLSGCDQNGEDLTNELTYTTLEVIDEWSPILEPKPNIRLHRNSPDKLLQIIVEMITRAQGAPFILNFDERSMAGLILEGLPEDKVWDYGCVGCLENTLQGCDRSGTVNCNPNLASTIELTLNNGKNMPYEKRVVILPNQVGPKYGEKGKQWGPKTGNIEELNTWEDFWQAWVEQAKFLIKHTCNVYNLTEKTRSEFLPTPYLSTIVEGCVERGLDIRNGGPKYRFITIQGVGYATTVDSLLAIKKFVYDEKKYTLAEVKEALINDYTGKKEYEIMRSIFENRAPKFGNDETEADRVAQNVMKAWSQEALQHKTPTDFRFRGGMLSWNYWAGEDAAYTPATPNGRHAGTFLSNAICPTNGADVKGPTSVTNSVGTSLGGKNDKGEHINYLPNGASHTLTFNPSILRDPEHIEKFKAYLRGYIENGGTALQINLMDSEMLKDAQKHPKNYKNLLVRVTGYNAYFTSIGKELQDEIIARESHDI